MGATWLSRTHCLKKQDFWEKENSLSAQSLAKMSWQGVKPEQVETMAWGWGRSENQGEKHKGRKRGMGGKASLACRVHLTPRALRAPGQAWRALDLERRGRAVHPCGTWPCALSSQPANYSLYFLLRIPLRAISAGSRFRQEITVAFQKWDDPVLKATG